MKHFNTQRPAFSLIEILIVVGIIALLLSIITSGGAKIRELAERQEAGSNARQIVLSYITISQGFTPPRNIVKGTWESGVLKATSIQEFSAVLADLGDLKETKLWFCGNDELPAGDVSIIDKDDSSAIDGDWETTQLSWNANVVSRRISSSISEADVLLLYTDGLYDNTSAYSRFISNAPWGADGGHFAFLDGHVEWRINLADGIPALYDGGTTIERGDKVNTLSDVLGTTTAIENEDYTANDNMPIFSNKPAEQN